MATITQKQYLLDYLRKNKGRRVPIYEFIQAGVYRYSARFYELRKEGYVIEKKEKVMKHAKFKNQKQVWYRLVEK